MISPNKVISFRESILGKMLTVLDVMDTKVIDVLELYSKTAEYFEEITELIYCLEVLYLLDIIDFGPKEGLLIYVKANQL